jgi:ligand-binding sensor domain-containing protein
LYAESNGIWQPYNLGVAMANAVSADTDGSFWIGSGPQDLPTLTWHNIQPQNTSIDIRQTALLSNWVRRIRKSDDGNLLIVHDAGIQKFNVTTNAFIEAWNIDNEPNINDAVELNGKIYAGTSYHYLYVYENNQWVQLGANDLPSNSVYFMDVDAAGNLWLTGSGYIAKYDGTQFTVFTNQNGPAYLNNLYARDIHCDKTRNKVWVATYAGIIEYNNGQFIQHTDTNTPGIQQYYDAGNTISEDAQHNIYIGTIYGAILKYDGTTWTTTILPEHVGNQAISDIAFVDSTMYISDNLFGIWIYENNTWDSLNTRNSALSGDFVTTLCVDANNNLWAGNLTYGIDVYNKTGSPLSVTEAGKNSEVTVFPNPSTGKFVLKAENHYNASLNIYSITGRLVQQTKITTATSAIDLSDQTPGIYLANIISAKGTQTIKLVVSQ